jgi:glycosyltransferase involved in cell wall biosynthesis
MNVGGPARQVESLARLLDPDRFHQRLLVGSVDDGEADDLELRGTDLPYRRITGLGRSPRATADAAAFAQLMAEIRRFRPHIVHTHTAKAGFLGRLAGSCMPDRRPLLVHTFHGHLLHGYFSPRTTRAITVAETVLARRSARLLAVGAQVRDDLLAAGVGRPEQYAVVPPGTTLGPLPRREDARARLELQPGPVVAFVGRLTKVKRPDRLVDIAVQVLRHVPDATFVVAGGGELEEATRARARDLGVLDSMRFLGWFADVESLYAAADLALLCSDNEGMPVSLIEAALAGLPAVSSDVGSAGEVVVHGTTGIVAPADAAALAREVVVLLGDEQARRTMGGAARARARAAFSGERLAADTSEIYLDALEGARARSGRGALRRRRPTRSPTPPR